MAAFLQLLKMFNENVYSDVQAKRCKIDEIHSQKYIGNVDQLQMQTRHDIFLLKILISNKSYYANNHLADLKIKISEGT